MSESKRTPHNTAKEAKENPMGMLADAMVFGSSESILRQESMGQQQLVESDTLPTEIREPDKAILEAAGVKFLGPVEGDEIFQYVELPPGWKKEPTNHSMWSKLVDDKGRERAAIFYKAAFYDRSAHMGCSRRFAVSLDYDRQEKEGVSVAVVTDCGKVIHTTEPIPADGRESWAVGDDARDAATAWLQANYPDWENPAAHWD